MLKIYNPENDFDLSEQELPKGFRGNERNVQEKHFFESRSEYACAVVFEKYIPNWQCKRGETYQVPIGFNRKCDFQIGEALVEYHVVVFGREFDDKVAYRKFDNALKKITPHWRHEIKDAIFSEFLERYYRKRKFVIETNPQTRGKELILAHSPQTLYHGVMKRFGKGVPPLKEFCREFQQLQSK